MQAIRLRLEEIVRLDRHRIDDMILRMGEDAAEDVICRAMEDLALRLSALERAYAAQDNPTVARGARGIAAVSAQIGMSRVAAVAHDVGRAAARGDMPALGATMARLMRVSEASLHAVFGGDDMAG